MFQSAVKASDYGSLSQAETAESTTDLESLHLPLAERPPPDFASQFDFCLVLPAVDGLIHVGSMACVQSLVGLFSYTSLLGDSIIVLARAPIDLLRSFAEAVDIVMKLNPNEVRGRLHQGNKDANIAPVFIAHRPEITRYVPCEHIYAKYTRDVPEYLYAMKPELDNPFDSSIRLKIAKLLMKSKQNDGSPVFPVDSMLQRSQIKSCFALADPTLSERLADRWSLYPFQPAPIDLMKEYYGANIGMQFAFADHVIAFMYVPGVLSLLVEVGLMYWYQAWIRPTFSAVIALWAIVMLEFWKRKEKRVAMRWGTCGFEAKEMNRTEFYGEQAVSHINGSNILYFSARRRLGYTLQHCLPIAFMLFAAIAMVALIYSVRYAIQPSIGPLYGQVFASVTNTVQIQFMNAWYSRLAKHMTERENHRTDTEYHDSMIAKMFVFQFTNSYASFFYLAFVAERIGRCPPEGCMWPIALNLFIVFGTKLVLSNWFQVVAPYFAQWRKRRAVSMLERRAGKSITRPEFEHMLNEYDQVAARLGDYMEIAIGFGYLTLFAASLPIMAIFLLISLTIGLRGDAWKLANLFRRTFPVDCEDIGTWQTVFFVLSVAAVVTNAGLLVFTMHELTTLSPSARMWIFVGFQWACFLLQAIIMELIPDTPTDVQVQLQRAQFIEIKVIECAPDVAAKRVVSLKTARAALSLQEYPAPAPPAAAPVSG